MRNGPFLKTILLFAAGCTTDAIEGDLEDIEQLSTCGAFNDAQHVNSYDGTLGPTTAFVQTHKKSKGALETTDTASQSAKKCSGSLISSNLFLTAGHCVDATTVGMFVAFNYERAAGSTSVLPQTHVPVVAVVEDELGGVDYAILRLSGSPGSTWGISAVASADPAVGAALTIIGHPNGEPKQIEAGPLDSYSGDLMNYGSIDTQSGSSGSAILDSSGRIVGVHTLPGCGLLFGANSGVRISKIRAVSFVL